MTLLLIHIEITIVTLIKVTCQGNFVGNLKQKTIRVIFVNESE